MDLVRAGIFIARDIVMKYDSNERDVAVEMLARKNYWPKLALQVNTNRLQVVFLLYLTQSKVENDPLMGPIGLDVFLALCRASLLCTSLRADFLCDQNFLPVSADDVWKNLSEHSQEDITYDTVTVS